MNILRTLVVFIYQEITGRSKWKTFLIQTQCSSECRIYFWVVLYKLFEQNKFNYNFLIEFEFNFVSFQSLLLPPGGGLKREQTVLDIKISDDEKRRVFEEMHETSLNMQKKMQEHQNRQRIKVGTLVAIVSGKIFSVGGPVLKIKSK